MPNPSVSSRECAELLLATIPHLMRDLAAFLRQKPTGDEPQSMGQFHLLGMLAGKPCSLHELAALHHVTSSTMSRTVDVLVQRGWIARQCDPRDRRQVVLCLTDEGRAGLAAMVEAIRESTTQLLARLDVEERDRLYDGLSALSALFARIGEDVHGDRAHCGASAMARTERSSVVANTSADRGAR